MCNGFYPTFKIELSSGYQSWHFPCKSRDHEKENPLSTTNSHSSHQLINEVARKTVPPELRISNFKTYLTSIKSLKSIDGQLLDEECAPDWFLEIAKNGFEVFGLEPDKNIFDATARRSLSPHIDYFPDALEESEKSDVIKHIPDINNILVFCHQRLNQDGLLVVSLPSSNRVFYRPPKIFCHFGFPSFLTACGKRTFLLHIYTILIYPILLTY